MKLKILSLIMLLFLAATATFAVASTTGQHFGNGASFTNSYNIVQVDNETGPIQQGIAMDTPGMPG